MNKIRGYPFDAKYWRTPLTSAWIPSQRRPIWAFHSEIDGRFDGLLCECVAVRFKRHSGEDPGAFARKNKSRYYYFCFILENWSNIPRRRKRRRKPPIALKSCGNTTMRRITKNGDTTPNTTLRVGKWNTSNFLNPIMFSGAVVIYYVYKNRVNCRGNILI